jgi:low temperature requirement protein LtrA
MILGELTVAQVGRAAFLLLIVWWAWISTTWMANWFDPASPAVRAVLTGVMLAGCSWPPRCRVRSARTASWPRSASSC